MDYLEQYKILPSFQALELNHDIVNAYYRGFPTITRLTVDLLSDGVGFDSKDSTPISHNVILILTQTAIAERKVNSDNLSKIVKVLDFIDFRIALLFFVQLTEYYPKHNLMSDISELGSDVFLKRLNTFLSVFTAELLCADNH